MPGYRIDRAGEDIKRELTAILRTVKDPRVGQQAENGLLSIVRVEVARDLGVAKVYVSSIDGIGAAKEAVKGLVSAAGFMRRELGTALSLRHTPELRFIADDSIEYGAGIAQTLRRLNLGEKETAIIEKLEDN